VSEFITSLFRGDAQKGETVMDGRKMLCLGAASFIGTMMVGLAVMPAHGEPLTKPVTVTAHKHAPMVERVAFGDLALATKDGRKMLYRRVGYAVDHVCPDRDADLGTYDVEGCKDFAWSGARPQIDRAIRDARSGASLAMTIEITSASAR
jgi:UrcA family protein